MKIKKLLITVGILASLVPSAFAQRDIDTAPVVPVTAVVKGRQSVVDYLDGQVDHVQIHYSGASVISGYISDQYYSRDQLRNMGYIHDGSFDELSSALASTVFEQSVVKTPDGNYDVQVTVTYYDASNKILMTSNGNLGISEDSNGNLYAGQFNPWTYIHDPVAIQVNGYIYVAKWIGPGWEDTADLQVYPGPVTTIIVPDKYCGTGDLVWMYQDGSVSGWDQDNGTVITGHQVLALLGKANSGDERIIRDNASIDGANYQFYQEPVDGRIYGRFPLTEVVSAAGRKELINPMVTVWGQKVPVVPSHIYVKPLYMNAPSVIGLQPGVEMEIPYDSTVGGFILNIPPGDYKMRIEFDGLIDWDLDPYLKG